MPKGIAYLAVLMALVCLLNHPSDAGIIHVPDQYPTIQDGLNAANPGDTVLVEHGTYQENILWPDTPSIKLFANEAAPPESTVIEPMLVPSPVITIAPPILPSPIDSTTIIRGFIIRNGYAIDGGGIYLRNASPTIGDAVCGNLFENNHADQYGGAIFCESSQPIIQCSKFEGDSAVYGGAIAAVDSSIPQILKDKIRVCIAQDGGGIYCSNNGHVIETVIEECTATSMGSALHMSGAGVVRGCTITLNSGRAVFCNGTLEIESSYIAQNAGGAIEVAVGTTAYIDSNTIEGNSAPDGPAIYSHGGTVTVRHNNIVNNSCLTAKGTKQAYMPGAIHVEHGTAVIENNSITGTIDLLAAGISVCDVGGSISNNNIHNNYAGVFT